MHYPIPHFTLFYTEYKVRRYLTYSTVFTDCAKGYSWKFASAEKEIRNDDANLEFNDFDLVWVKGKLFFQEKGGCVLHANTL